MIKNQKKGLLTIQVSFQSIWKQGEVHKIWVLQGWHDWYVKDKLKKDRIEEAEQAASSYSLTDV